MSMSLQDILALLLKYQHDDTTPSLSLASGTRAHTTSASLNVPFPQLLRRRDRCRSRRDRRCQRVGVHCATSAFRVSATPIARYEPGTSCESLCESDSDISRSEGLAIAIVSSSKNIIEIHVCVRSRNDTAFS